MKNFTLITALSLCSFSWTSVSVSGSQTVEVQPGQDVTLPCNIFEHDTVTYWFRLINSTNPSCISVKDRKCVITYCTGFENGRFEMSSNNSTVSLRIKPVDLSDSGLYFCGFSKSGGPAFGVIHLKVKGKNETHDDMDSKCTRESDGITNLTSVILGTLIVLLVMVIIGLVVQNRKLQTADKQQNPEQSENVGSDDLNYAAVTFGSKARRRELEPNVVYAATR
ncbi:uncharacterized protein ABDE67_020387 [Symphorus nematophorus]